jgi:hypothetical protein
MKITVAALLLLLYMCGSAQNIQINIRPITNVTFGSKDFWNIDVITSQQLPVNLVFKTDVKDRQGNLVAEALSKVLTLQSSFTSLTNGMAAGGPVTFHHAEIRQSDLVSRSFPAGEYQYCVAALDPATSELIAQQCMQVMVKMLTPPILVYPSNKETIQEQHPLLTWLSPGPLSSSGQVSYALTLVELYPDQNPFDALLRNRPLLHQKNIPATSFQYPYNSPALAYGKHYAWQVEAMDINGVSYGQTEIWSFTLAHDSATPVQVFNDQSYIDIRESAENGAYYAKGLLKIKYTERKFPSTLSYLVFDTDGHAVTKKAVALQALGKDNWYELDFEKELHLKHNQKYRFELYSRQQVFKFYFTYINPVRTR